MSRQIETIDMERVKIAATPLVSSRIALGTWAMGGWMWGGTDEAESIRTIHEALDRGITLIDTAPVYGFGRSEEIVGKALAETGRRQGVVIATKVGLDWKDANPFRNGSKARIVKRSRIRCGGSRPTRSTSTRCTGPIRRSRSRKPPPPWRRFITAAKSGRSASAIFRPLRWMHSAP